MRECREEKYFPIFINLKGKKVIVFGAGAIGGRRIKILQKFGADICVISPSIAADIEILSKCGLITHIKRVYQKGDCTGGYIVVAATSSRAVNQCIFEECSKYNILVNVADCKEESSFYFPGIVEQDNIVIGVSASGLDHQAAKKVTDNIRQRKDEILACGKIPLQQIGGIMNITIGSRESRLAIIQSETIKKMIEGHHSEYKVDLLTMKTTGDIFLNEPLDKIGGKGLFLKELDRALMTHKTDLSVHSLKDVPMDVPDDLPLLAFSKREDPRDVMILPKGTRELNPSKPIGCSSARRILQLKKLFPESHFKGVRGNIITRLDKLDCGEYAALILAYAGIKRLGLEDRISRIFETTEVIPAAGQGILVVQGRRGEDHSYLDCVKDREATLAALCERACVHRLGGGCSSPIAAYAKVKGSFIRAIGLYFNDSSNTAVVQTIEETLLQEDWRSNAAKEQMKLLGCRLAESMLQNTTIAT